MRSRRRLLPILLVLLAACGDAAGPGMIVRGRPAEELQPQVYPLRTVDGYRVPFMVGLTESGQIEIIAGSIALTEATREYHQQTLWRHIEDGRIYENLVVITGRFTRVPAGLEVITTNGVGFGVSVRGDSLVYRDSFFRYAFAR